MENMFDFEPNITDESQFNLDCLPETLKFREKHQRELAHSIVSHINYLLYGLPGTGKTLIAKYIRDAYIRDKNPDATFLYVSCLVENTPKKLYTTLLHQFNTHIPSRATEGDLLTLLQKTCPNTNNTYIILDEIDRLDSFSNTLKIFSDVFPRVILILITNDLLWPSQLPQEVKARVGWLSTFFDSYTPSELAAILEQRAEKGMRKGCWNMGILNYISAKVKSDGRGDARMGIKVLERSARLAEKGDGVITDEIVNSAFARYEADQILQTLSNFPDYVKAIYMSLYKTDENHLTAGELYALYSEFVVTYMKPDVPISYTTYWKAINEMSWSNLIATKDSRGKGGRGQTRDIYRLSPREAFRFIEPTLSRQLRLDGGQ